jgi:membrane associated rhomboid family serine protease
MSFTDRDYARTGGRGPARLTDASGFGRMRMRSFTTWLIIINVAVFLLDIVLKNAGLGHVVGEYLVRQRDGSDKLIQIVIGPLELWGQFSATTAIHHFQLWRFITFQFLHANIEHILFNMFGLFIFGGLVERYFGSVRYLAFYLLCGIAGPVAYMMLMAGHLLVDSPATPLVGASAGIFGVLIAAAVIAPDATVLIYGIVPAKLRHVAIFLIFLAGYTIWFFPQKNGGGEAAHLGGAAVGYLLIRRPWLLDFTRWFPPASRRSRRGPRIGPASNEADQREVDRILSKIATQGLDSLSEDEKRTLTRASKGE